MAKAVDPGSQRALAGQQKQSSCRVLALLEMLYVNLVVSGRVSQGSEEETAQGGYVILLTIFPIVCELRVGTHGVGSHDFTHASVSPGTTHRKATQMLMGLVGHCIAAPRLLTFVPLSCGMGVESRHLSEAPGIHHL